MNYGLMLNDNLTEVQIKSDISPNEEKAENNSELQISSFLVSSNYEYNSFSQTSTRE